MRTVPSVATTCSKTLPLEVYRVSRSGLKPGTRLQNQAAALTHPIVRRLDFHSWIAVLIVICVTCYDRLVASCDAFGSSRRTSLPAQEDPSVCRTLHFKDDHFCTRDSLPHRSHSTFFVVRFVIVLSCLSASIVHEIVSLPSRISRCVYKTLVGAFQLCFKKMMGLSEALITKPFYGGLVTSSASLSFERLGN